MRFSLDKVTLILAGDIKRWGIRKRNHLENWGHVDSN